MRCNHACLLLTRGCTLCLDGLAPRYHFPFASSQCGWTLSRYPNGRLRRVHRERYCHGCAADKHGEFALLHGPHGAGDTLASSSGLDPHRIGNAASQQGPRRRGLDRANSAGTGEHSPVHRLPRFPTRSTTPTRRSDPSARDEAMEARAEAFVKRRAQDETG